MSDDQQGQSDNSVNDPLRLQRGFDRFGQRFSDLSDNIGLQRPTSTANGHVIHFHSVASGATVHFKAFLTEFADRYESEWNDEETFGRMDPISTFKRTRRTITLGWDVPAASVEEAKFNLREAERFVSMLYPVFEEFSVSGQPPLTTAQVDELISDRENAINNNEPIETIEETLTARRNQMLAANAGAAAPRKVGVMVGAPLFKLKFSNLVMDNGGVSISGGAVDSGLVGKLSGLTYQPDIESGFFGHTEIDRVPAGTLLPQTIKFSCEFTVLHTNPLGWSSRARRTKRSKFFPYHAGNIPPPKRG